LNTLNTSARLIAEYPNAFNPRNLQFGVKSKLRKKNRIDALNFGQAGVSGALPIVAGRN
jgi:hypothetical protein